MSNRRRRVPGDSPVHGKNMFPAQCYASFAPGDENGCLMQPVIFNRYPDETAVPAEPTWLAIGEVPNALRVYDPFYQNCCLGANGLGDVAWITYSHYWNKYQFIGSSGLTRTATLTETLTVGESASATIVAYDENGDEISSLDIDVEHWQGRGDDIANGSSIVAHFSPTWRKWFCNEHQPEPPP